MPGTPFVLPAWLSPSHPIVAAETRRWRKNLGWQITRLLLVLTAMSLMFAPGAALTPYPNRSWADTIIFLATLRRVTGVGMYLLLAISAAATAARTLTRTDIDLLRVTPMPVFEMVYDRGVAVWRQATPLIAVYLLIGLVLAAVYGIDLMDDLSGCITNNQFGCVSVALPGGKSILINRHAFPNAATHAGLLAVTALAASIIRPAYALPLGL